MEFQVNAAGKRIYPTEFKRKILEELSSGATSHELARKYGIAIQNIIYWKKAKDQAVFGKTPAAKEETVPAAEYRKLLEENKNLRKSLSNAVLDRDILKEAVSIASKKKWI
jgi:transposase-like protein